MGVSDRHGRQIHLEQAAGELLVGSAVVRGWSVGGASCRTVDIGADEPGPVLSAYRWKWLLSVLAGMLALVAGAWSYAAHSQRELQRTLQSVLAEHPLLTADRRRSARVLALCQHCQPMLLMRQDMTEALLWGLRMRQDARSEIGRQQVRTSIAVARELHQDIVAGLSLTELGSDDGYPCLLVVTLARAAGLGERQALADLSWFMRAAPEAAVRDFASQPWEMAMLLADGQGWLTAAERAQWLHEPLDRHRFQRAAALQILSDWSRYLRPGVGAAAATASGPLHLRIGPVEWLTRSETLATTRLLAAVADGQVVLAPATSGGTARARTPAQPQSPLLRRMLALLRLAPRSQQPPSVAQEAADIRWRLEMSQDQNDHFVRWQRSLRGAAEVVAAWNAAASAGMMPSDAVLTARVQRAQPGQPPLQVVRIGPSRWRMLFDRSRPTVPGQTAPIVLENDDGCSIDCVAITGQAR